MKIYRKDRMYITFPEPEPGQDGWLVGNTFVTLAEAAKENADARAYVRLSTTLNAKRIGWEMPKEEQEAIIEEVLEKSFGWTDEADPKGVEVKRQFSGRPNYNVDDCTLAKAMWETEPASPKASRITNLTTAGIIGTEDIVE